LPLPQILRQGCDVEISPALAERILNERRCEYHLPPARRNVEILVGEIRTGRLRLCQQGAHLWFALQCERLVLLKGWARLAAVVGSRMAVRFWIGVTRVGSQDQLRALAVPAAKQPSAPASE
jgi:hypothetical protein